jgi:hypothetical protein
MNDSILNRLPRFDDCLGDSDISVLHNEDTAMGDPHKLVGDSLAASGGAVCALEHLEPEQLDNISVLEDMDIERIVQNLSTGLQSLEVHAKAYLHTQLTEVALCLFPKLAATHFSAELLAQISHIAGRLPNEVIVRVSPELAQQLDGKLEAAVCADIAFTLEATSTLDFTQVQLRWGAGGGDLNLSTLLEDILQKYAPITATEET